MAIKNIGPEDLVKGQIATFTKGDTTITGVVSNFEFTGGTSMSGNMAHIVEPDTYKVDGYNWNKPGVYIYALNQGWTITVDEPTGLEAYKALPVFAFFRLNNSESKRIKLTDEKYWIEGDTAPYLASRLHLPGKRVTLWED